MPDHKPAPPPLDDEALLDMLGPGVGEELQAALARALEDLRVADPRPVAGAAEIFERLAAGQPDASKASLARLLAAIFRQRAERMPHVH